MNQEPTQDQFDLLTHVIGNTCMYVSDVLGKNSDRLHSFEDIIVKAFVGEYQGEDYGFVALKVDTCSELANPWVCWSSLVEDWWGRTDDVETNTSFCLDNMMLDVSEQAKNIYSTFLI